MIEMSRSQFLLLILLSLLIFPHLDSLVMETRSILSILLLLIVPLAHSVSDWNGCHDPKAKYDHVTRTNTIYFHYHYHQHPQHHHNYHHDEKSDV